MELLFCLYSGGLSIALQHYVARVGIEDARVGLGAARVGLEAARVGLEAARVGLEAARVGLNTKETLRVRKVSFYYYFVPNILGLFEKTPSTPPATNFS